jgi:ABC-type uncharacterized transport system involved in gliding motility auxiliary subunit
MVLGGTEQLDEYDLYRIDHYIQSGGKAFFALETVGVETEQGMYAQVLEDRGLAAMVASYGVEVEPALVLDTSSLSIPIQSAGQNGITQIRILRYPFWVSVKDQTANKDHPISSELGGLDLFWASPLKLTPPEGVEGTVLFTSTPEAWLMTGDFVIHPDQIFLFNREEDTTRGAKDLAAALSGKLPSWFNGVEKPWREGVEDELPDLPPEPKESRIVVVGDVDLGGGFVQYTRSQQNLEFIVKALDWLSNDDDIIAIRNRQAVLGRLDKIIDPEKREGAIGFARIFNIVVVPVLIIILGFIIAIRRRRVTSDTIKSDTVKTEE